MTEISKLFENAGVNKSCHANIKFDDCIYSPSDCGYYNYPDFTAEKQLEFVKFMLHKGIYYDTDGDTYWFHYTDEIENATYRPFEEAIAEFINGFWQNLTNQEKEEIRRILNENS